MPEPTTELTVAVIEARRLHADALALLLDTEPGVRVVAATTIDEVGEPPDAAAVLVAVDDPRGIELAARIAGGSERVRVVGLHSGLGPDEAASVFDARVRALVRRDAGVRPVADALGARVTASSLGDAPSPEVALSAREREVLELIAGGYSASAIARRLHLSAGETAAAKRRALRKLGTRTQGEAVARARRLGVLGSVQE